MESTRIHEEFAPVRCSRSGVAANEQFLQSSTNLKDMEIQRRRGHWSSEPNVAELIPCSVEFVEKSASPRIASGLACTKEFTQGERGNTRKFTYEVMPISWALTRLPEVNALKRVGLAREHSSTSADSQENGFPLVLLRPLIVHALGLKRSYGYSPTALLVEASMVWFVTMNK